MIGLFREEHDVVALRMPGGPATVAPGKVEATASEAAICGSIRLASFSFQVGIKQPHLLDRVRDFNTAGNFPQSLNYLC